MSQASATPAQHRSHQLVLIALVSCVLTLVIATVYPSGKPADESMSLSFGSTYGWIAFQSIVLALPGLLVGLLACRVFPRVGALMGAGLMLVVPLIVLCDVMAFTWIAERFLSRTMTRIGTTLLPGLMLHVSQTEMLQASGAIVLAIALALVIWKVTGMVARRWQSKEESVGPAAATILLAVVASAIGFPGLWNLQRTTAEMAVASVRHPFCAFHLVGFRGVGVSSPNGDAAVLGRLHALRAAPAVLERESKQQSLRVDDSINLQQPRPDVIVIVIECFRPEVIDPEVMPNLHAFAAKSILCRNNFSSGNATCYGMFSLFTGLEAVWFDRPVSSDPIMNRLMHQAGYQLGFYGGQTDWRHFGMAGFVHEGLYDDFQIELPDLPASDLRTVQRTVDFIDQDDEPRAAVAYMFATHSFYSEEEDRIFQPAAPDNIIISHAPEMKDQIYNRYKNSVRTMDTMIKPLLREDCTVIVLGDHGEPFLDDGTAVHGTRLSKFQNMTPALIYSPGIEARTIEPPTSHADLLPTLLSILDIPVDDPSVFDGVDLTTTTDRELIERTFVSCNYMDNTSLLVGPWTLDQQQPFGHRVVFDLRSWQAAYLNPIGDRGFDWTDSPLAEQGAGEFKRWILERFGEEAYEESSELEELFAEFLRSPIQEVRLTALEIAGNVAEPQPYLYELVAEATRNEDEQTRSRAKDLIIRINRLRGSK